MVLDHEGEYRSRSVAISSVSQKVGCSRDSLRIWIKQHETDSGLRGGMTTVERDRIKELEREKFDIARCTFERLMRDDGIEGVRRGKKVKTTFGQPAEPCTGPDQKPQCKKVT